MVIVPVASFPENKKNMSPFLCTEQQPFGAVVSGFDVTNINAQNAEQLKQWLGTHGVVVLRDAFASFDTADQVGRDAAFVKFLGYLGPLTFTDGETPVTHQPLLNCVSNVGRSTPPKSVFHTDTSYVVNPPAYTSLRAVALPKVGGDTVFSNQFLAYDTLPLDVKQRLAGATVLHKVSGLPTEHLVATQCWHPLYKVHPISGRTALFLSTPKRCQELSGLSVAQAQRSIRLLYAHSTRAYRALHHRWQHNDLLIWDNRCTMHRGDHATVVGDRVFHRGMVLPSSQALKAQDACTAG